VRIQRRFVSLVAGLVAVAVVSACGGSSSTTVISGKTPAQILAQALSKANGQKFSFTSSTTLTADMSQVTGFSPSQLGAFGPAVSALSNGVNLTIDGTYESPTRTLIHIKLQPICSGDLYVEDYDGQSYISSDGQTWTNTGASSSSSNSSVNQSQVTSSLSGVGFKDNGSTSQDGQTVEDLRLDFNNQLIQKIATASGQASSAAALGQFVTITGDGVDVYVQPSNGLPESVKGTLKMSLDVTSIVQLLSLAGGASSSLPDLSSAGGKLGLSVGENLQFSDWGNATVTKPSGTGTAAPTFCPELGGLGALGGLAGGGGSSIPTPDLSGGNDVTNSFSDISNGLSAN
jgi:hypothetical protein